MAEKQMHERDICLFHTDTNTAHLTALHYDSNDRNTSNFIYKRNMFTTNKHQPDVQSTIITDHITDVI